MTLRWQPAPTSFEMRSALTEIHGPWETGKTIAALTAPPPIYFLTSGEKINGIIQRMAEVKDIHIVSFPCHFVSHMRTEKARAEDVINQAYEHWCEFEEHMVDVFPKKIKRVLNIEGEEELNQPEVIQKPLKAKSVIVDAHPDFYKLCCDGLLGNYNKLKSQRIDNAWGPPKYRWRNFLGIYRAQFDTIDQKDGVNLILVGDEKDKYGEKGKIAGVTEPVWEKSVPKMADVILRTSVEGKGDNRKFKVRVDKAWNNIHALGRSFDINLDTDMTGGIEALPLIWAGITKTNPMEWS